MLSKRWLRRIAFIGICTAVWNWPVTYRVGEGGKVIEKTIPLYAKTGGFLYRDWMYKDIVGQIITDRKDDAEKKILKILHWTNSNIKAGLPGGMRLIDDHPLNIVIRQYGTPEQVEDIFTVLCAYAGFRSGMEKCRNADRTGAMVLSFVNVKGRWLVFHASKGKYFMNSKGSMGSVNDYIKGDMALSDTDSKFYSEYLDDMKNQDFAFTRADEQMPLRRPIAEVEKALRDNR